MQGVALVLSAENRELDETALTAFSGRNLR